MARIHKKANKMHKKILNKTAVTIPPTSPVFRTLGEFVLFSDSYAHIVRMILCYTLMGCSISQFAMDVMELHAVSDLEADMLVEGPCRWLQDLREVDETWQKEVDLISENVAIVQITNGKSRELGVKVKEKVCRLTVAAGRIDVEDLDAFKTATDAFSNARRLVVSASISPSANHHAVETGLANWLKGLLPLGGIKVLRWEGPADIDVLRLASGTRLEALLLDALPLYENEEEDAVSLPTMKHLSIILSDYTGQRGLSSVLKFLQRAHLPLFMSLTLISKGGFPHLKEFLDAHKDTIRRLRVYKDSDWALESPPAVVTLPSMAQLEEISWQLTDLASIFKSGPYEQLTELELFGFGWVARLNAGLRERLVLTLIEMVTSLRTGKLTLCPRLSIVRVHEMTLALFRETYWSKIERACLGYCFCALKNWKISFLSTDGGRLQPSEMNGLGNEGNKTRTWTTGDAD
ncbi:hypothetical protein SCHPADRAFT_1003280 [Schizopora paradoxa]|uniref:Uncharacterized protein n=1 Tax=Schizopora paradoxa TaxID=27342 RepID=A0A0H2QZS2_9AGAM|nr:hypothetical protein SCHPADRAFT_1003280 [Schizopora paradoxa]